MGQDHWTFRSLRSGCCSSSGHHKKKDNVEIKTNVYETETKFVFVNNNRKLFLHMMFKFFSTNTKYLQ